MKWFLKYLSLLGLSALSWPVMAQCQPLIDLFETQLLANPDNLSAQKQLQKAYAHDCDQLSAANTPDPDRDAGRWKYFYDLSVGYQTNPLGLTSSKVMEITLPSQTVQLEIASTAQPQYGARGLGVLQKQRQNHRYNWFINSELYTGRQNDAWSAGMLYQRTLGPGQGVNLYATLNKVVDLTSGQPGIGYQTRLSPGVTLSADLKAKLYQNQSDYDALNANIGLDYALASRWQMRGTLEKEQPFTQDAYPGGGFSQAALDLTYRDQWFSSPFELQVQRGLLLDQSGYSRLIQNGAERRVDKWYLRGKWWLQPKKPHESGWYAELFIKRNRSNIELFDSDSVGCFLGTSF